MNAMPESIFKQSNMKIEPFEGIVKEKRIIQYPGRKYNPVLLVVEISEVKNTLGQVVEKAQLIPIIVKHIRKHKVEEIMPGDHVKVNAWLNTNTFTKNSGEIYHDLVLNLSTITKRTP